MFGWGQTSRLGLGLSFEVWLGVGQTARLGLRFGLGLEVCLWGKELG